MVERNLAKVEVASSTLVSRSIFSGLLSGGFMERPRPACFPVVLLTVTIALLACGDNRSLQSVKVSPATASSHAQFSATGIYNSMPTSVDITSITTWCIGSSNGICAGDIVMRVSVINGLAQCLPGFTGTVTVLAGQAGPPPGPDVGSQLNPFGMAQFTCP